MDNKKYAIIILVLSLAIVYSFYLIQHDKTKENNNKEEQEIIEVTPSPEENITKEEKIENYFTEEIENDEKLLEEDTKENKSKLKESFVTLTDFIFYNGEIKGTTFSELKTSTQEKLLDKWNQLDSKIENKYPNYKEKTFNFTSDKYTKVKEKANELKNIFKDIYDEKIKSEEIESKKEVVKEKATAAKEKVKEKKDDLKKKLKSWYEEYREED